MAEKAVSVSVSVSEKKKKKKQQQARPAPPFPSVRDVIQWTLLHAGIVTVSFAFGTAYDMLFPNHPPPSWLQWPTGVEVTDAELAEADALGLGVLWCAAAQTAAGALALKLPIRHRRRLRLLLAYTALVATVASHCMLAALVRMSFAADQGGGLFFKIICLTDIFTFGVGDLLCFLGLVLRGGEEAEE